MAKILWRGDCSDGFLRGKGAGIILNLPNELHRHLMVIERAGRVCYRSERKEITQDTGTAFIRRIIASGHESVIEHSSLTVMFENVSRGFTHEMVRHRLCAFSQESTRYVDYAEGKMDHEKANLIFVMPPHRDLEGSMICNMVEDMEEMYKYLREIDWKPEDARQFLPNGLCSKIVVTANFREWRHIFEMRCQKVAHWEIRYIMCDLLRELKVIIPVIFEDFQLSTEPDKNGYRYATKVANGF